MPKYIIERDIPGAGALSQADLQAISQRSCCVLQGMGPTIQWIESFVTDDKVYCIYLAASEDEIRKHGEEGGFPVTSIREVKGRIDPTTAES